METKKKALGKGLEQLFSNNVIDFDNFEEGILPSAVTNLVDIDPLTGNFVSKDYPDITIATIYDIFDAKERRLNALVNNDELNTCDYGS